MSVGVCVCVGCGGGGVGGGGGWGGGCDPLTNYASSYVLITVWIGWDVK